MFQTSNVSFQLQSTTSNLLVYIPSMDYFNFSRHKIFSNEYQNTVLFLGRNIWYGNKKFMSDSFNFIIPFIFSITKIDNQFKIECPFFEFVVDGFDDISPSIYEELKFLWVNYALEDDNKLTVDAIELKNHVLQTIIIS